MAKNYRNDLNRLRQLLLPPAKWQEAEQVLQGLLRELGEREAMRLAVDYVELYAPRFKRLYPEADWLEERLQDIKQVVLLGESAEILPQFPDRDRKYDSPLARTFLRAMQSLWAMAKSQQNFERLIENAYESITTVLTVARIDFKPELASEFAQFGGGKTSGAFEASMWAKLVDEIDKRLQAET